MLTIRMLNQLSGEKIKSVDSLTLMIVILLNSVQITLLDVIGMQQELENAGHLPLLEHAKLSDTTPTQFALTKTMS